MIISPPVLRSGGYFLRGFMKYTIHQRENGNYYTRIVLRDQDGKERRKKFTARTKKELERLVANYAAEAETYDSDTFRSAMEDYIQSRVPVASPSTTRTYLSYQKRLNGRHAWFTALYLDRIRTNDLQKLVSEFSAAGLASKTIHSYMGFIEAVLIYNGRNVKQAHLPEMQRKSPAVPDADLIQAMLHDVKGTSVEIPFRLALYGLRRGEICALDPLEDLNGTVLHVHRSMAYMPLKAGETVRERVVKSPKTPQSDRYVSIDADLAEMIRSLTSVTHYAPDKLSQKMSQFIKQYNPEFHMHTLRHFFASYLHEQGVPDADILAAGGWKTDNVMKSVYRQALNSKRASDAISSLLSGGRETKSEGSGNGVRF